MSSSPGKPKRTTVAGRMKKKHEAKPNDNVEVIEDSEKEGEESEEKKAEAAEEVEAPIAQSAAPAREETFKVPETPANAGRKPRSSSVASSSDSKRAPNGSADTAQEETQSPASPEAPESIPDTDTLVTPGGKPRRKQKTEAERIQFFKDDPRCAEVEPHRILCKTCGEWQELHPKRRYIMQNWLTHRRTCSGNPSIPLPPVPQTPTPTVVSTPARTPAQFSTSNALGPMEAEGKATLENDFRTGEIRPHQVFCTQCATWVKLYPTTKYSPKNWLLHIQQCPGATSSSKVPTTVGLSSPPPVLEEDGTSSTAVPSTPAKSDNTHTYTSITPPPSRKRPRDDESDSGESVGFTFDFAEARRQRRRTESYIPAFGWALWDMVSNPIAEFIEGFKHGVRNELPPGGPSRSS